jgi:nucleoside-diphosphate-sugar epimerase
MPSELIAGQTFNAGYQNQTVAELAEITKKVVEEVMPEKAPIEIITTTTNDNRSYHVSSRKIAERLGYVPSRTIEDAVRDLCQAFRRGEWENSFDEQYFNVKHLMNQPQGTV